MNKNDFVNELSRELNYSLEKCIIVNDILERNFFISKKNKELIIEELIAELNVDKEEADNIYDIAVKIIKEEVKNKLKHPFQSQ